jgi:hypothetical protein
LDGIDVFPAFQTAAVDKDIPNPVPHHIDAGIPEQLLLQDKTQRHSLAVGRQDMRENRIGGTGMPHQENDRVAGNTVRAGQIQFERVDPFPAAVQGFRPEPLDGRIPSFESIRRAANPPAAEEPNDKGPDQTGRFTEKVVGKKENAAAPGPQAPRRQNGVGKERNGEQKGQKNDGRREE